MFRVSRIASRVPSSTWVVVKFSITFDMITIGKMLTLSSAPTPKYAPTTVSPAIIAETSAINTASRATSWIRNHCSALRRTTPSPTITQKIVTPQARPVMRNASDTITGANVPKVSMPTTLRKITTMHAITGSTRIRLIAWSGTWASTAADQARTRLAPPAAEPTDVVGVDHLWPQIPERRRLDHRHAVDEVRARHVPERQQRRLRVDQHELPGSHEPIEHRAEHLADRPWESAGDDQARVAQRYALLAELQERVQPGFVARRDQQEMRFRHGAEVVGDQSLQIVLAEIARLEARREEDDADRALARVGDDALDDGGRDGYVGDQHDRRDRASRRRTRRSSRAPSRGWFRARD